MPLPISLMIHTASCDDFLAGQGLPSYFQALTDCLRYQNGPGFELIYTDTYHAANQARFAELIPQLPFQVKHVPLHPEHRYWFDRGYCFISAAKNNGILYADGELLISCDDAEFLPTGFLATYWKHYKQHGRYCHALHKRLRALSPADREAQRVSQPLSGDFYVSDHRWKHVEHQPVHVHRHGTQLFAGASFALSDALTLNGYNERMDGCKSLEDCDFGYRLQWLGRSFALDRDGWLAILDHPSYSDALITVGAEAQESPQNAYAPRRIENLIAVENYGVFRCSMELSDAVANKQPLTEAHMKIIQRETIKYRGFDPLAAEHAATLAVWMGTPTFDLRSQRALLRQSPDWRW